MEEFNEYNDWDATSCVDDYNAYEECEVFNDHEGDDHGTYILSDDPDYDDDDYATDWQYDQLEDQLEDQHLDSMYEDRYDYDYDY
jgi:hypothetical protein